ncbi:MAG: hypothetical protein AB7J40_05780 [Candidatus Altimarinota bacterium]
MESFFSFFANIPTSSFYIGGIVLLYLIYKRYDENTRYNKPSSAIQPPTQAPASPMTQSPEKESKSSPKKGILLTEQMIQFLKSYGAVEDSWVSWGIKKMFPEELLVDLREKALKGDLKAGMSIEIKDGKWRIL